VRAPRPALYSILGEQSLSAENIRKSYELRDLRSEREKLHIEGNYYLFVVGDLEKARQAFELWAQTYPRDFEPPTVLAISYGSLGQYENALAGAREAIRLNSGRPSRISTSLQPSVISRVSSSSESFDRPSNVSRTGLVRLMFSPLHSDVDPTLLFLIPITQLEHF
jgi:tetratricopeptide (TPR) repeat protein